MDDFAAAEYKIHTDTRVQFVPLHLTCLDRRQVELAGVKVSEHVDEHGGRAVEEGAPGGGGGKRAT